MADNIDPLKQSASTASKVFYPQVGINYANTGGIRHQPSYNSIWKRQSTGDTNNPVFMSTDQQSKSASNKRLGFFNSLNRSLPRTDSLDYGTQNSFPPTSIRNQLPQRFLSDSEPAYMHHSDQRMRLNLQNYETSFETCTENPLESYTGEHYRTEEAAAVAAVAYPQEEQHNNQKPQKKKGLTSKLDRFVRRIPAIGKVYKQSSISFDRSPSTQQFQYDVPVDSVQPNQFERVDTANNSALNQRYTNKTQMKSINLQMTDQTQPVDVRIHLQTNKIFACDVGRSLVEIYDINGALQHVIDDPKMIKFRPTAVAVAFDETVIIASHFHHCLHMYSPSNTQNINNSYMYKQFKLGNPGDQLHQFYHPAGIAIDHTDGNLYVCDRGNYRIQVIRPDGICERVIELYLHGKKKHSLDATRIAIQSNLSQLVCIIGNGDAICFFPKQTNGRIYVDPVYICDANGLGIEGASGLAVDTHDRIFISDTIHHRIVICTPEGGFITSFGTEGSDLGQFKRPCGLDLTSNGTLVVTDPGNKRLQILGITQEQQIGGKNLSEEILPGVEDTFVLNL